jgi:hypothetical protein
MLIFYQIQLEHSRFLFSEAAFSYGLKKSTEYKDIAKQQVPPAVIAVTESVFSLKTKNVV